MTKKLTEQQFNSTASAVGLLSENRLKVAYGVERKTPNGVIKDDRITGSLLIETGENEIQEVSVFIYKTKADGTEAKKWAGLLTVAGEYKSIKEHGRENADLVNIFGAVFETERYVHNGQEGSKDKINVNSFAGQIKRLDKTDDNFKRIGAETTVDVVMTNVKSEFKDGEETGRKILEGYYMNVYNGNATTKGMTTFVIDEEHGAEYIADVFEPFMLISISADLINIQEKKVIEEERSFGAPKIKTEYNYKRENFVTGGNVPEVDGEIVVFNKEDVTKALAALEQKLAEKKDNNQNKQPSGNTFGAGFTPSTPKNNDKGFDIGNVFG